jgi:small conductance mechanosensitive channel
VTWVATHIIGLAVGIVILLLFYRFAKPIIHRFVMTILKAQQATLDGGGGPAAEVRKRAATLEELLSKLIRAAVIALALILFLAIFDLWPMLAGLGLIAAALTIAGQAIILDYLMGILILVEGQYFNGDWIVVNDGNGPVEGEVQEVGLRRTVLRDTAGTVHSVSNGVIRVASNMTRVFGVATVEVHTMRTQDLDKALEIIKRVASELAKDRDWREKILDAEPVTTVTQLTVEGAVIRIRIQTEPNDRWAAASELRRRLAAAFSADQIAIGRWDAIPQGSFEQGLAAGAAGTTMEPRRT